MGNVARAILSGGMIAGTIDVGMASLIFREKPPVILCNIAGGLVGESAAHSGGLRMALLGLLLQWAMSLLMPRSSAWLPSVWRGYSTNRFSRD